MYDSDETQQKITWILVILALILGVGGYFYTKNFNPTDILTVFNGPGEQAREYGSPNHITHCRIRPYENSRYFPLGESEMFIGDNEFLMVRDVNPYDSEGVFYSLLRNNVLYLWDEDGDVASKNELTPAQAKQHVAFSAQISNPQAKQFFSSLIDIDCDEIGYDASKFNLPEGVEFKDNSVPTPEDPNFYTAEE